MCRASCGVSNESFSWFALQTRQYLFCREKDSFGTASESYLHGLVSRYSQIIDNLSVVVVFGSVYPMIIPAGFLAIMGRTFADGRLVRKVSSACPNVVLLPLVPCVVLDSTGLVAWRAGLGRRKPCSMDSTGRPRPAKQCRSAHACVVLPVSGLFLRTWHAPQRVVRLPCCRLLAMCLTHPRCQVLAVSVAHHVVGPHRYQVPVA